jgi:putative membrane protein
VSFSLLGIEAIGLEIENSFGYDGNDLPWDN